MIGDSLEKQPGFTLIELMAVVAIVAILAAVAVPSYQQFVQEGRRAEGVAFALDIASRQERHYTQFSRYAGALTGAGNAALNMPSASSENGYYTGGIVLGAGNTTFTITVTPATTDTECGFLTLDNTGLRGSENGVPAECWR